jgi:subtilisin family serine protease
VNGKPDGPEGSSHLVEMAMTITFQGFSDWAVLGAAVDADTPEWFGREEARVPVGHEHDAIDSNASGSQAGILVAPEAVPADVIKQFGVYETKTRGEDAQNAAGGALKTGAIGANQSATLGAASILSSAGDGLASEVRPDSGADAAISVLDDVKVHPERGVVGPDYARELYSIPTDTLFPNQWHLLNTGQDGGTAGVDINVTQVWDEFTGAGVNVGIWDDGVQYTHPDLDDNYNAALNIADNSADGIHDALPQDIDSAHGTAVAGLIAAENNGTGTVGVAYGASITGVDLFFDPDLDLADSMNYLRNFDVTNHSWGFTTPFAANILDPDPFWQTFFGGLIDSVNTGRGGLGTINLVANGNDRLSGRDGNDSNFTNLPQTIAVGAIDNSGFVSFYSTPGANLLVGTTSSGLSGIWTTDRTGADGYSDGLNEVGNTDADYTAFFGGTSAATPITAGVVALMLEANPDLGWRDVQEILASTARHTGSDIGAAPQFSELYTWDFNGATHWNGGGMHFSNDYGFGLTDALAAVRLAETWTQQNTFANWNIVGDVDTWTGSQVIVDDGAVGNAFTFNLTADAADAMDIETVVLLLQFDTAAFTGDYLVTLTSPDGTVSTLSVPFNGGTSGTSNWFYSSNAFRGESGLGAWTVSIDDQWGPFEGTLTSARLQFYGGAIDVNDTYVFTNEYSDYAGLFGHLLGVNDTNGGVDTLNLSAVTAASYINLSNGSGNIDGVVLGSGSIIGIDNVTGGDGNDILTGDGNSNVLLGMRGNDRLDGGLGADVMDGFTGDDRFFVDNAGDQIIEGIGQGNDRVLTSVNYTLTAGAEIELFTTTTSASTTNLNLTGNAFGQTIQGNLGNNRIDGGAGVDIMQGFAGDDRYYVDAVGDQVIEVVGQGNDTVLASVSYILAAGQSIETMTTTNTAGTGAINLTGNAFDQTIRGNNGSNALNGLGGNDVFDGLFGDDRYYVDSNSDVVIEAVGRGNDRILASASYSMTTGVSVETLSTQNAVGTLGIKLYGNEFAQTVQGNFGANTLNGRGGADILTGLQGSDIFEFTTAFGAGNIDQITDFNVVDDTINIAKSILSGFTHTGTLFAQEFFASTLGVASSATHRFIYDTDDGKLFYDADGVGGAAGVEFATLSTGLAMTNADFFVI